MIELQTLNNKQLREKCLEYGLPNIPVTDSSRKVLIKRLEKEMLGKDHSKAKSSPANRRKTVPATITTTISSEENHDDTNIKTKRTNNIHVRRTVAPNFAINRNSANTSVASKPYAQSITPMELNIGNRANSINNYDSHQRRSVSLSKTGILTTSYNQETSPLQKTYEQNGNTHEEMQDEDEVDEVQLEVESPHTSHARPTYSSNYTQSNYNQSNYNTGNFTTLPMPSPTEPSVPKLYPNLHTDYYGLDDMLASHSSSMRQSKLGFTNNPPTSYIPPLEQTNTRKTFSGLGASTYGGQFSTSPLQNATSNIQNSPTKRYTIGGVTKRHTARSIDDEGGASSSDDGQFEAPYLNKFSRNLDNLRSEALATRSPPTSFATPSSPTSRYSSYSPTVTRKRRAYDDNDITFAQFWTTLDQKYHLKQAFMFAICFIVAVFIYVFFLQ